jgi:hypothetical protein
MIYLNVDETFNETDPNIVNVIFCFHKHQQIKLFFWPCVMCPIVYFIIVPALFNFVIFNNIIHSFILSRICFQTFSETVIFKKLNKVVLIWWQYSSLQFCFIVRWFKVFNLISSLLLTVQFYGKMQYSNEAFC